FFQNDCFMAGPPSDVFNVVRKKNRFAKLRVKNVHFIDRSSLFALSKILFAYFKNLFAYLHTINKG
ncbi:hypothetical protein, partial [Filobacillus milosensis]|uniref:hypothetical protein n=1 Tax=Filobacillus milosensis TaxID=94137 RepID=UPI001E582EB4